MENYQFQRHNFSKDEIKQAADSNLEIKDLGILSHNTENKLQILEQRTSGKNAKYDDLVSAVKLYDNVIKMSKEKRAKVDYENLRSRAQNVYTTLADSLAKPESIETVIEAQPTEVVHTNPVSYAGMLGSTEKKGLLSRIGDYFHTVPSRAAGRVRTVYIAAIAALALAPALWAGYNLFYRSLPKNPDVVTQENIKPAPVTTTPVKVPDSRSLADKTQQQTKGPEVPPVAEKPTAPQTGPAPYAGQRPSQDRASEAYTQAKENQETEANLESLREAARKVAAERKAAEVDAARNAVEAEKQKLAEAEKQRKAAEADRQRKEAERKAAEAKARKDAAPEFAPVPAYSSIRQISFAPADAAQPAQSPAPSQSYVPQVKLNPPTDGGNMTVKGALRGEGYFDPDTTGGAGTGKLILDAGPWGVNAYGNTFATHQDYEDYNVDGNGARFWGGAYIYLPLGKQLQLFLEGDGGFEQRNYTIKFDSGNKFKFGNESPFVTAKIGLTDGQLGDVDNYGVGDDQSFILLQGTKHFGSATGDAKEQFGSDYSAFRFSADGRLMLDKTWSIEAGVSTLDEKIASDFMKQKNWAAEAGMRWHAPDHAGYVELLGVYQDLNTTVAGDKSDAKKVGPRVGAGWRIASGDTVTLDATIDGAYLFNKDKNEWQVLPGFTLWFGGKKAK